MTSSTRFLAVVFALTGLALASCDLDPTGSPCTSSDQCPFEQVCVAGKCVESTRSDGGSDGGTRIDGGMTTQDAGSADAGVDAGVADAGEASDSDNCYDGVDNDGDDLIDCVDPDCEGKSCRARLGPCDRNEVCADNACPADQLESTNTICRLAIEVCDRPEYCDGVDAGCPNDVFLANVECRPSVPDGGCDVPEVCDGTSKFCPTDVVLPNNHICRPKVGACDLEETCNGTTGACPPDNRAGSTSMCRQTNGECDLPEFCNGGVDCPDDKFSNLGTVCHASAGPCDQAEVCSGTTAICPPDTLSAKDTICQPSRGDCDIADKCDGVSPACPNVRVSSGTECRAANGICDVAETCSGTSDTCPPDGVRNTSFTCRLAVNGQCDTDERCDGSNKTCPTDMTSCPPGSFCTSNGSCSTAFLADGQPCTSSNACQHGNCIFANVNDTQGICCNTPCTEQCGTCFANGSLGTCTSKVGTECRASAGICDKAEQCIANSLLCPADERRDAGTVCKPKGLGACDVDDVCDGTTIDCAPKFAPNTAICRAKNGSCDVADLCTGASETCPADAVEPSTTVCGVAINACDKAEFCTGDAGVCPANLVQPNTTQCGAASCANGVATPARFCNGLVSMPACSATASASCNGYQCNGAACRTNCQAQGDCMTTHYCNTVNGTCQPKIANNLPCTLDVQCGSGVCQPLYPDSDNDGFGDKQATVVRLCIPTGSIPSGYSTDNTDCCDSNDDVFPGQTKFYVDPFTCGSKVTSYDYNCDTVITKRFGSGKDPCSCARSACVTTPMFATDVACGDDAPIAACTPAGLFCATGCTPTAGPLTKQQCR